MWVCIYSYFSMVSKVIHSIWELWRTWLRSRCLKLYSFVQQQTSRTLMEISTIWGTGLPKKCSNSFEKTAQEISYPESRSSVTRWGVLSSVRACLTLINSRTRCTGLWRFAHLIWGTCTRLVSFFPLVCGWCESGKKALALASWKWQTVRNSERRFCSSSQRLKAWAGLSICCLLARIRTNTRLLTPQDFKCARMLQTTNSVAISTSKWSKTCYPPCPSRWSIV